MHVRYMEFLLRSMSFSSGRPEFRLPPAYAFPSLSVRGNPGDFVRYDRPVFASGDTSFLIRPEFFLICSVSSGAQLHSAPCGAYYLIYMIHGQAVLRPDGEAEQALSSSSGCFLDGQQAFSLEFSHASDTTVLALSGELTHQLYRAFLPGQTSFSGFPDFASRQYMVLERFHRTHPYAAFDLSCHLDHLLTRLLLFSAQEKPESLPDGTVMMQVVTYIQQHFAEPLSVEQLAARFHYSASHFRRSFYQVMHCSPKEYLSSLRLQHAEHLLLTTKQTVAQIAQKSGFHNTDYFIQSFKRHTGTTPLQYRKQHNSAETGAT